MKKKYIIIAIVIIAAIILYVMFNKSTVATAAKKATGQSIWPLGAGYTGDIVKDIQNKLNRVDPTIQLPVDGKLGPDTQAALKRYVGFPVTADLYQQLTDMAA